MKKLIIVYLEKQRQVFIGSRDFAEFKLTSGCRQDQVNEYEGQKSRCNASIEELDKCIEWINKLPAGSGKVATKEN